jgi:hypothetical protein
MQKTLATYEKEVHHLKYSELSKLHDTITMLNEE